MYIYIFFYWIFYNINLLKDLDASTHVIPRRVIQMNTLHSFWGVQLQAAQQLENRLFSMV